MLDVSLPTKTVSRKVQKIADRISAAWQKAVDGILSVSQLLKDAENQLNDVEQMDLYGELPFSKSTADKLLSIANDKRLNYPSNKKYLPPHWATDVTQTAQLKLFRLAQQRCVSSHHLLSRNAA